VSNGTPYFYEVTAVDATGTSGFSNEASATPPAPVLHSFGAGLIMISAPVDDSNYSLAQIFNQTGVKLAVWEPTAAPPAYVVNPTAPADTLRPGQGYWARFATQTNLLDVGPHVDPTQPITVSLAAGWNMIGVPRAAAVATSALGIEYSGQNYSFTSAVAAGVVATTMYTYQAGDIQYEVIPTLSASLKPYYGYWLYAYHPCTVVFTAQ
jgi:hypothetical protein